MLLYSKSIECELVVVVVVVVFFWLICTGNLEVKSDTNFFAFKYYIRPIGWVLFGHNNSFTRETSCII